MRGRRGLGFSLLVGFVIILVEHNFVIERAVRWVCLFFGMREFEARGLEREESHWGFLARWKRCMFIEVHLSL